ncbi:MAG: flagellar hook-associated protein FlgK [Lachnospirales bacterium]
MGFSSLSIATSGMRIAQANIAVTGHNLANVGTLGYTRQGIIQGDFIYRKTGVGQLGLGTDIQQVRQIRDKFIDVSYREEVSKGAYFGPLVSAGQQIENLLNELKDTGGTQSILQELYASLETLSQHPESLDTRGTFISTAISFLDKMKTVYNGLEDYQENINLEVKNTVDQINSSVKEVKRLNGLIAAAEVSGQSANDYRDQRNVLLDELSQLAGVTYSEDANGSVDIYCEGQPLLSDGYIMNIGLRYIDKGSSFVEPVFTNNSTSDILPADKNAMQLYDLRGEITVENKETTGYLKGLLVARGSSNVNYATENDLRANKPVKPVASDYPTAADYNAAMATYDKDMKEWEQDIFNVEQATIPKFMASIDTMFHQVVRLINDSVAPTSTKNPVPEGLDESILNEIFVRDSVDRYYDADKSGSFNEGDYYIGEDGNVYDKDGNFVDTYDNLMGNARPTDSKYFLYSIENVNINEKFLNPEGYDKIPLSPSGDLADNTLVLGILNDWNKGPTDWKSFDINGSDAWEKPVYSLSDEGGKEYDEMGIESMYNFLVTQSSNDTAEAQNFSEAQNMLIMEIDSRRQAVSGVSLDEEMSYMMQYQYSFQAASQLVGVVDEMLDTLINRTGRVGL